MPAHPKLSLHFRHNREGNSVLTCLLLLLFVKLTTERKTRTKVSPELLLQLRVWVCVWGHVHKESQAPPSTSSEAGACLPLHRPRWSSPWGFPVSVSHPAGGALGLQMWVTTSGCFTWVLGSLLRPSHLHNEHLTHWTISSLHLRLFPHTSSKVGLAPAESVTSSP